MNTERPCVSIITPTYNHERFIAACIESVLAQDFTDWEQIIVDDGSRDTTWPIVQRYVGRDARVRGVTQPNKGPARLAETYNTALHMSRGRFIAVLEGDDYWLPHKLTVQLAAMADDVIFSYGAYFDEIDGRQRLGQQPPFSGRVRNAVFFQHLLLHRSHMLAVTQLVRRDALERIDGFHQDGSPAAVDMATLLRLARLPGFVSYLAEPLGVWRHHVAQATSVRAIQLARHNGRLALAAYDRLAAHERRALHVRRGEIVRVRSAQLADAYFGELRGALRRRDRSGARELVAGLWRHGGPIRKVQAMYAVLAILLRTDFEPVLRITERWRQHETAL